MVLCLPGGRIVCIRPVWSLCLPGGRIVCIRQVWSLCLPGGRIVFDQCGHCVCRGAGLCSTSVVLCLPGGRIVFDQCGLVSAGGQDCVLFDQCGLVSAGGQDCLHSTSVVIVSAGGGQDCVRPVWSCVCRGAGLCSTSVVLCLPGGRIVFDQCGLVSAGGQDCVLFDQCGLVSAGGQDCVFVRPAWSCVCRGQDCLHSTSVVIVAGCQGAGLCVIDQCGQCGCRRAVTGPGGLGLTAGQTEPRWPGQRRLDRVAQVGSNMAARGSEWNPGGQVNDGWTVWPKRVGLV